MNKTFILAMVKVTSLSIVIFVVSAFFIHNEKVIGWVVLGLGILSLASLKLFKIPIINVWPDIIFGIIDNGILAILAIVGGAIAGVSGAVIGGAVGNAITDGIAGLFEGDLAEKLRVKHISEERTMLGSAVGKMTGCLLGAGVILVLAGLI
ncbi:MAG: hypothetical protein JJE53_00185 [Candidatus Pacebacteria bacterium]|nr:hypothetical protein [Candidatus Paceibacterota bacterium]